MSNPLIETLHRTRQAGRMALCGYFLVGYPTPDQFFQMVRAAHDLDVLEFGIPADDPLMDGPVIASAHHIVTGQRGIHAEPALALIGGLRNLPQPRIVVDLVLEQVAAQVRMTAKDTPLLAAFRRYPADLPAADQKRLTTAATTAYETKFGPICRTERSNSPARPRPLASTSTWKRRNP